MQHASLREEPGMRALICGPTGVQLDRLRPIPEIKQDEALIRVLLAGICATDLEILGGYAGFDGILGHEFVGRVVEAPGAPAWRDLRVVGEITVGCGRCPACQRRERGHCVQRTVMGIRGRDGAFAEYLTLPLVNLHRVPDGVADRLAVFTEPLAAALEILEQTQVRPSDRVVVVGDGKLGLLVAQVLALTGCEIVVIGRHARKQALLERRGIPILTGGAHVESGWADLAVACSGSREGLALAHRLVRPRGRLVVKSTHAGAVPVDLAALVVDEITMLGSRCGPFAAALRLLAGGYVEVESMIDAVFPLEEGVGALERSRESGVLKVLIQP
ncbi:MAG: alcohol dehydrogenase catalytic domain-containing protein [Magnetococcus sp. YQC-9]